MEEKIQQYLHQKCCRMSEPKLTEGFLMIEGEDGGDELLYTTMDYELSDKHQYYDMELDKEFDTYDELIKHIESLTL